MDTQASRAYGHFPDTHVPSLCGAGLLLAILCVGGEVASLEQASAVGREEEPPSGHDAAPADLELQVPAGCGGLCMARNWGLPCGGIPVLGLCGMVEKGREPFRQSRSGGFLRYGFRAHLWPFSSHPAFFAEDNSIIQIYWPIEQARMGARRIRGTAAGGWFCCAGGRGQRLGGGRKVRDPAHE